MINADDKLKDVFRRQEQVSMFEMTKLVSKTPEVSTRLPERRQGRRGAPLSLRSSFWLPVIARAANFCAAFLPGYAATGISFTTHVRQTYPRSPTEAHQPGRKLLQLLPLLRKIAAIQCRLLPRYSWRSRDAGIEPAGLSHSALKASRAA